MEPIDTRNSEPTLFNDPAFQRAPYPTYQRLRRDAPFRREQEAGLIFVSRYADVDALLRDRRWTTTDYAAARSAQDANVMELKYRAT